MRNNNFIVVQGWMINELGLKGYELLIYAIIYGFSQDGESKYNGSLNYMSELLGITKPTIIKYLKSLVEQNYIIKEQMLINNVVFNTYKINLLVVKNFKSGSKENLMGVVKNFKLGSKNSSPNNNINNNSINNNNNIHSRERNFIPPTLEEVKQYCKERHNTIDASQFIDFYESKNWMIGKNKMKDWKAAVRTWEHSRKTNNAYTLENGSQTTNPFLKMLEEENG